MGADAFPEGTQPLSTDDPQRSLVKINQILYDGGGGGGGSGATYSGSGSPQGVQTADPGNTYWDQLNSVLYIKDSGVGTNTGWLEIIAL